ncbi:Urb2/Npa2 family [Aspergillus sclerotialis]|uniref:Urb2/Npa2 family n=1 Tax=Aspergillus sclerotialis TaxID=2070753 RepID=A0A3A2Z6T6_9EURO|nr:Urb2/Npa2 family [Aspergillus sclerotialis]
MATPAEPSRSSQESMLGLEKTTGSPHAQLTQAAQILGIDLALCASHPALLQSLKLPVSSTSKAEWTFRWLIKNLKQSKQFRVHPWSFMLLKQILDLNHTKSLIQLLAGVDFLAILNDILSDLEEAIFAGEDGSVELPRSESDSSMTAGSSPLQGGADHKKGTKRKRPSEGGNGDAMEIDDTPQTPASSMQAFIYLLDCLYTMLYLATETQDEDANSRLQLTQAMQYELEPGAIMLRKSFNIAAVATSQFFQRRMTTELQHLMYVLPSVIGIWRLKSLNQDGTENKASNEHFAKHTFPSALRLQRSIALINLDTDDRTQALFMVHRLIAAHVVLPARVSFFERGGSGIDYSADEPDWDAVRPVTETFKPLLSGTVELEMKGTASWKMAELIPDLFGIAARATPRDTFRRQTHESPWLETLFVAVAELAYSLVKEDNPSTYVSEFASILEQLLRVVHDRDVNLSLPTLLTHAGYTGLLKENLAQVEWNLTAMLIELGVDIFLPNSGFNESKKLLNALLEKIMMHRRSGTSDNYDIIKNGIVIPLMRGFTAARDLPTFMEMWYSQLTAIEEARFHDSSLDYFSVWEDDDLCNVFSELVQTPFMDAHTVTQIQAAATELKSADRGILTSPSSYAKLVVLEASFRRRKLNRAVVNEALRSIVEEVTATLSSQQSLHWRWRLWRFARNLLENNLSSIDNDLHKYIGDLVETAADTIQCRHKDFAERPCAPLENFEAFRFILVAMNGRTDSDRLKNFKPLIEEVLGLIGNVDSAKLTNLQWNGRVETLNSLPTLALGYFLLLVRSPATWAQINVENRRSLFGHMLSLAAAQYDDQSLALESAPSDKMFLQAWGTVVCHEYLLNMTYIISDLIHVLVDHFKSDASGRKLYVESLQRIPTITFTRRETGIVLNLLLYVVIHEKSAPETTVGMVSLMANLAHLPKSSATITSDWEPIWKMGAALSLQGSELDFQLIKAVRSLNRAVITKLMALSPGERKKVFKKLTGKLTTVTSKLKSINDNSMDHVLVMASLTFLWAHREQLSDELDESQLLSSREKVFDSVIASLKHVKSLCKQEDSRDTVTVIKVLNALGDFADLAMGNKAVAKLLGKIEENVEKSDEIRPTLQRLIRRCVLAGQEPKKNITKPALQCAEVHSIQHLFGEDQQRFIKLAMEKFQSMEVDDLAQVLMQISDVGFYRKGGENRLLLAALVVAAMPSIEVKDSKAAKSLTHLFATVSRFLPSSKSVEQFSLGTECIVLLFRQHPRAVDQLDVDGLFSSLAECLGRYGPHISPKYSSAVYIRICRVVGVVLGVVRVKVGGRHHVVITVLRGLLNCLLDRSKKQGRSVEKDKNQPNWLATMQASDAAHFTRLLTSLSDPTVSAVSRPTGREALTDQTKKAKSIAGQYLQYFIMDYSRMCLQGSFLPEIKSVLMPGLYAVLASLSRESMRSLNDDLEISSRAVFKGLYDDYMRFGRWNKG